MEVSDADLQLRQVHPVVQPPEYRPREFRLRDRRLDAAAHRMDLKEVFGGYCREVAVREPSGLGLYLVEFEDRLVISTSLLQGVSLKKTALQGILGQLQRLEYVKPSLSKLGDFRELSLLQTHGEHLVIRPRHMSARVVREHEMRFRAVEPKQRLFAESQEPARCSGEQSEFAEVVLTFVKPTDGPNRFLQETEKELGFGEHLAGSRLETCSEQFGNCKQLLWIFQPE